MQTTQEYWATVALAATLVVGGVVLARPVFIVGATMIGAWLLARQYAFARALADVTDGLSITQELTHDHVVTDRPTPFSVLATCDEPTSLELTIEPGLPVAATVEGEDDPILSIKPNGYLAESVVDVTWPIAGTFQFDPPTVRARDPWGLFEERLARGPTPTVEVNPRGPQNVHVGKGGDRLRRAFGEHEADPLESGLTPEEIREYVSGDAARLIDWKSTARMGHPHVREFESETNRQTLLLIDHRGTMADGPDGQTKFDYARHVALSLVEQVQESADPLGLYAFDDDGVSTHLPPRGSGDHYATIRSHIHDLTATPGEGPVPTERDQWTHLRMRQISMLSDDSTLANRLQPYAGTSVDRQDIEDDPLLATVRTHISQLEGGTRTIIISDDTHRSELREAALLARRGGDQVLVMLAPTVLFKSGGFADLTVAYNQYSEFETFRQSLDRLDRVSAVELAPGDRLSTVLSAGRRTRRTVA